jgi:hypothetical protein
LLRLAGNCPPGESQASSWTWTWLNLGARSARLFRPGNPGTDAIFAPLALDMATGAAKPAMSKGQLVALKPPRLPYHEAVEERFGIDRAGWKALVEAIYPNAETADAIVMALSYCRARNLDPFKRPVHIVPMWSSVAGKMIETVWPGISELRTTAFRTGQYAGMPAPDFGPTIEHTFKGKAGRGKSEGQERSLTLQFPEWCRVTITRELTGKERSFVGPKVYC